MQTHTVGKPVDKSIGTNRVCHSNLCCAICQLLPSCSNCNLGLSIHWASSSNRGATPLSKILAMGGSRSMPGSQGLTSSIPVG